MRDYAGTLPVLLDLDLLRGGWDGEQSPYPGISTHQVAFQWIRKSLLKKFEDVSSTSADLKALNLFGEINEKCKRFEMPLPTDFLSDLEAVAFGEARDFLYNAFYVAGGTTPESDRYNTYCSDAGATCNASEPDNHSVRNNYERYILEVSSIVRGFGLGNGSNIGSPGTDLISKLGLSTMSATDPAMYEIFAHTIANSPLWSSVESTRRKHKGNAIVRGSRLSFVPKSTEISRTICTEPVLNMLFQKGVAECLEERLREVSGIDLSTQPNKNQQLARIGSIDGTYGTIDLSSASDSMSITLVKNFFPKKVFDTLNRYRSPITVLPDGSEMELHMVSSMGNAFTFPLQTLFFCSLVFGAYRAYDIKIKRPSRHALGNFAVFGDDIVVDHRAYDLVCRLLHLCGFSVNKDKSFNTGHFRESCGRDYWCGHNVRGVYIKTLKTDSSRYSAINRLVAWSARWGVNLRNTIDYIRKGLRKLYIPYDEMDDGGLKVPFSMLQDPVIKTKYFVRLTAYKILVTMPVQLVVSHGKSVERLRGWFENPDAIFLAAVAGTLRSGVVSLRVNRKRYRVKQRYTPRWDYISADAEHCSAYSRSWKEAAMTNLSS